MRAMAIGMTMLRRAAARAVSFFTNSTQYNKVDHLLLAGGVSATAGLAALIEKEKLREKKSAQLSPSSIKKNENDGGKNISNPAPKIPPTFAEVKLFFEEKDIPLSEAERFFDHYESNGWLVGGKSKMKNWEAAARNWLKNSKKFNDNLKPRSLSEVEGKRNNLQATTNKSYKEPL